MLKQKEKLIFALLLFLCILICVNIVSADSSICTENLDNSSNMDFQNDTTDSNNTADSNSSNQGSYIVRPTGPIYGWWTGPDNIGDKNVSKLNNENIKKVTPKVIAKNKVFHKNTKVKKYTVTLKNKDKKVKNAEITLKIKGKLFKAKTNNDGKATFKITKLNKKGIYKANILFKENKMYKATTKTINIKVK